MRLNSLFILLLAASLSACSAFRSEVPSKAKHFDALEARPIALPAFNRIVFDADALITLRMGAPRALVLSTEPDHFGHLSADVVDGELLIRHTGKHSGRRYVMLDIVTPDLAAVEIHAVVEADFRDIKAENITIEFDGIGEVTLQGSCQRAAYQLSWIGEFDASQFLCHDVVARISGIGDAAIFADGSLSLEVSGIGDVTVLGGPRVGRMRSSGIGDVSFRKQD